MDHGNCSRSCAINYVYLSSGRAKIQVTFPRVRVQVTTIQINEQHKKCLLTLFSQQNALLDRGESVWFVNLSMEQ